MTRAALLAMTLMILAGSWETAGAQASAKPANPTKNVPAAPASAEPALDTAPAPDSVAHDSVPKKKGGLFGKAKGIMKNKVVQTVAKTAACTMVPGGQAIAGAIDAASSDNAGQAASGAAGGMTGTSCMPGVGGAGAGAAGLAGGGGVAGLAGAGLAGAASGAMSPGATGYAPEMGPGMVGMGMPDPKPMADCMGLTVEEYNAMVLPTGGEPRQPSKAEMKRMEQVSKKVGPQRQATCSQSVGMQQANAQMAQMQQMMAMAQARMPGTATPGTTTEAPGETLALSPDLAAELAKGKTVIRGIDWVAGSAEVSPQGQPGFQQAMASLGAVIKASGQRYRLDLYMDQRYDDTAIRMFGPGRLERVASTLAGTIGDAGVVQAGKTKRDKNPRLEVIKVK